MRKAADPFYSLSFPLFISFSFATFLAISRLFCIIYGYFHSILDLFFPFSFTLCAFFASRSLFIPFLFLSFCLFLLCSSLGQCKNVKIKFKYEMPLSIDLFMVVCIFCVDRCVLSQCIVAVCIVWSIQRLRH